ncbi:hypothetical protein IE53DRAFT_314445 [Violaceomyces palustris]|uniref:Uncharacterized protein n=1 Tax=Violaceomyces palustris TaxID=1673888 RepID=A0ACD0NZ28_9BASI|nr:hypothetical protein IE53DRAFT_314445 [Violaceomyces palustris]
MPLATPKRSALTDITNIVTRDAYSTPVRPPATPLSRRVPNTSYHSSAGRSLVTPSLITPAAPKRISLGMTPRGQRAANSNTPGSKRPLFSTPFKGGKRPENPLASPAKPLGSVSHSSRGFNTSRKSQAGVGGIASIANVERAVFDLRCEVPRVGMREYGIKPESVTPLQAVAKGAPDEIISILQEPSLAAMYAFDGPDGNLLRPVSALAEIRESGCRHVDIKWVNCHWDLILWKLASLCLNKPEEARVRFSWPELIRQMKYRYEREINLAQRSCIKRIQEHDSSASSPMVLCVYKVLWDRDDALERGKGTGEREGGVAANMMELTDGWYRIRCSIDSVLSAALARGRIKVGHKLAIMGAKLQSKGEPAEVLDAFATSIISISGNSTSLAKWDARLGFCREPFYASLRSLTADGGLVAAMDVVITQVYPYAYFDIDKGQTGQQSARGEAEESACKEAYERRYKETKAKLEQGWASKGRRLDRLLLALESVAEDVRDQETNPGIDDGGLEEQARDLLSQLEWEDNPEMAVRQLVVQSGKLGLLPFLVQAARQKCYFEREDDGYALEAELSKLCPPRKVRNFRVVKFRDARLPPPATNLSNSESRMKLKEGDDEAPGTMDKRRRSLRTVQLTVWDAINLGDGLEVGRRYIVTNLVPTQKSSWRGSDVEADIFLSTRRDTKWRLVDDR